VYRLWVSDFEESEAAGCEAYSCEVDEKERNGIEKRWFARVLLALLEYFFLPDFA
jgi:hypothetical protein